MFWPPGRSTLLHTAFLALGLVIVLGAIDPALAQPFGLHGNAAPEPGGFAGWILAEQARFYLKLSSLIRESKTNGSAAYALLGISFIYGVFHAAGPGHGKAVISSYLIANDETWRRGVVLSFASAVLQSLTAIAIVNQYQHHRQHISDAPGSIQNRRQIVDAVLSPHAMP